MRFKRRKVLSQINLLDLPNCLILQLLSYLDATSLYVLSRTCERLDDLVKEHTSLWRHIDARRPPNDREKIKYCINRIHDETHTFLIQGDNPVEDIIPEQFFKKNILRNITVLGIENQTIDDYSVTITSFPGGLHELSLRKTAVANGLDFFRFSGDHMKCLRVLILDGCDWVTSSAFMPISKYKSLEILSVYKCRNIDNSLPYLSLSGQYGFKQLKIFDARLSPLGNTLLRSLYKSGSLLAIYLQNEDISYKLDYFRRKLNILKGAPTRDYYVEDEEFDLSDSLMREENGLNYEDPTSLDDKGLLDYLSTSSEQNKTELPRSFLYVDPYNTCTCGCEERQKGKKNQSKKCSPKPSDSDDSGNDDDDDDDDDDHKGARDALIRELEEKVDRLSEMVLRSQLSNGWSRGLNSLRAIEGPVIVNGDPAINHLRRSTPQSFAEDEIDEIVRKCKDHYYRFQLLPKKEASKQPSIHNPVIEIHLNPGPETDPRKRPSVEEEEPKMKKQKLNNGEDPTPGPSGLNNFSNEQDDSDSDEEHPVGKFPKVQAAPVVDALPIVENADNDGEWPVDLNIIRIEHVDNVAKENFIPLKRLSLRGYKKITDVVLYYIKDLELDLLDLTYTNVTVGGINNYLVDHPSCRVVHEKFCVCPTNLHF